MSYADRAGNHVRAAHDFFALAACSLDLNYTRFVGGTNNVRPSVVAEGATVSGYPGAGVPGIATTRHSNPIRSTEIQR
jgi:hypothetical protein